MKFAAIDIGSNAIRLLFVNVYETKKGPVFHKDELIRIPIRLGEDAFLNKEISQTKVEQVIKAMIAFKHLIEIHQVISFKAFATSAMRDANNGNKIVEQVKKQTGIQIEIISGEKESKTILQNQFLKKKDAESTKYLYIDVGGGSTELALIEKNKIILNKSFNIGTLRILNDQVTEEIWKELFDFLLIIKQQKNVVEAIGAGGNINKIIKMYDSGGKQLLTFSGLVQVSKYLENLSMLERIRDIGLKPDRADVIIPALKIYINVMKWAGIKLIHVPKQGLSDGIIVQLYEEHIKNFH